ncbi:hypothetical protein H9L01_05430 [Erysipelothrix inopinata]|uniref:Bacteriophage abortive infection AbiH family protein n=1 Tax=Erysipelothrix inopinata TaxID=225084 RepID=A0A7G9RW59_9FIRM|nr:AbiH family protein [Erysipelothrix inopinata]QNN59834.1 hypothetical protein H9L01_05430 [Erysipelothrix inopinata]
MTSIVVIGNGFDLHHGLKTNYSDFFNENINNKDVEDYNNLILQRFPDISNDWTKIENNILKIRKVYSTAESQLVMCGKVIGYENFNEFIELQKKITKLFIEYLKNNTHFDNIQMNPKINGYLIASPLIVNFNYTDTVESIYCLNCKHPNGFIDNGYVIFGHMMESIPHDGSMNYDLNIKHYQRIIMSFYNQIRLKYDGETVKNKLRIFEDEVITELGIDGHGAGIDESYSHTDPDINYFIKNNYEKIYRPISYFFSDLEAKLDINQLVVMGHGIEADTDFYEIVNQIYHIKEVIIFSHDRIKTNKEEIPLIKKIFRTVKINIEDYTNTINIK